MKNVLKKVKKAILWYVNNFASVYAPVFNAGVNPCL
jgi:hypothetical protein